MNSRIPGSDAIGCVPGPTDVSSPTGEGTSLAYGKKRFFQLDNEIPVQRPSIREQLESYIANVTDSCVNFTGIAALTGQNITKGHPLAEVSFGREEVDVFMHFPIIITLEGRPPITRMVDFRAKKNARLSEIQKTLNLYTSRDNANLTFNLGEELRRELSGNYEVKVERFDRYDIFVIKDYLYSDTNSNPFTFQVARQDRWPVLDYITQDVNAYKNTILQGKAPYYYPNESVPYDYFVPAGTEIQIIATAHDPDEDSITFS